MANTHFPLLFILIISSSFCVVFCIKTNFTTDQSSLLAIKDHITNDPHHILARNWSTTTSFCNWIGVICCTRHFRVTALNLSHMDLEGTIPPHIRHLSFLVSIDLSVNNFYGYLPQEFSQLRCLKIIDFTDNNFSGVIPSWIGNFSELESLVLEYNSFTSSVPKEMGNSRKLNVLWLRQNHLSGTVPSTIFNLSSLRVLNLSNNSLSGSLPNDMCKNLSNIEYISFSFNKLHGQLPYSIGECTNLKSMSFALNKFFGGIPTSIRSLHRLKKIYVYGNTLNGPIPSTIFDNSSLEFISIGHNFFSGVIPQDICRKLPTLRNLYIPENDFTGSIPKDIYNCSFVELDLSDNHFTGEMPREIDNLHDLEFLSMASNNLYGEIPHAIFNSSKLQFLYLYDNHLSGSLPSNLGFWLPSFRELVLAANNLSGRIPSSISNASSLILLDLPMNSFSGFIPNTLGNLRQLERLRLYENKLTVKCSSTDQCGFFSSLANCKKLSHLDVSSNPLDGILYETCFGNLSTSLEEFLAYDCKLKGNIPREIGNFTNMMRLSLSRNELTGSIPTTIGRLHRLQGLYLYRNKLQGFIPHTLCNLQSLSTLSLVKNELSGPIPSCIGNLTSSQHFHLSSNNFFSTIPSSLWDLKDILEVDISSNAINGSISVEIQNLRTLLFLDLSSNQISGNIPTTLGGLQTLQNLSLSDNKLQGSIPDSFGSLMSLVSLDLSNNNLSGVIPESLVKLTCLKNFNVSFNKLEGRIPTEGPFKNFSTQSYMENYGLCGPTYLKVPRCRHGSLHEPKSAVVVVLKFVLPAISGTILIVVVMIVVVRRMDFKRKTNSSYGEIPLPIITWRMVSYHELFNATNGFSNDMLLGMGSFGSVYRGNLADGMVVAVKVFKFQIEDRALESFKVECEVMRNIRHRNIVQVITVCCNMDFKALVLQFMPNGSLERWLYSDNHFLNMKQRIDIMIHVASALDYLHNGSPQAVVHCDLKPNNVLLDEDMVAHVTDFGISKLLRESDYVTQTITLATFGYMAPEYGLQGNVSTKSDVYSYGILLLEVFTRKKPTDHMFNEKLSLKSWACQSLPDDVNNVVDMNLFGTDEEQLVAKRDCILSILELALECCTEHPEQRKNMGDVVNSLEKIKTKYMRDIELTRPQRMIQRH